MHYRDVIEFVGKNVDGSGSENGIYDDVEEAIGRAFKTYITPRLLNTASYPQVKQLVDHYERLDDQFDQEDKVTFVHPDNSRKYIALRAPDGRSITYDLVEWANELKTKYVEDKESLDSDPNVTEEVVTARREAMENVVAKLDLIREAMSLYVRNEGY